MSNNFKDSLSDDLVNHISAMCGRKGEEWFEELPCIIGELESRWQVKVAEPFPGIEYNFVAKANCQDGGPVVVKISPPLVPVEIFGEAKYLRTRRGAGAVKLLAEERDLKAILLERALPGEALFEAFKHAPGECVRPAIEVLRTILRSPPSDMADVVTLDGWFSNFRRYKETDFPRDAAAKAFEIYERLSTQEGRTFYLHGDFHPGNIVSSDRAPFIAIDPKGIVGHLGYDIAVFLMNLYRWQKDDPNIEQFLDSAIFEFSEAFEFEPVELREWAFAHTVIGAWWNYEDMPEHYDPEVAMPDIWGV